MLACLYLTANIFLQCGMLEQSKEVFLTLLKHIEQLWDSSEDANSASPFEVELHQQLLSLAELTENAEEIEEHTRKLKQYQSVFGDGLETLSDTLGTLFIFHANCNFPCCHGSCPCCCSCRHAIY